MTLKQKGTGVLSGPLKAGLQVSPLVVALAILLAFPLAAWGEEPSGGPSAMEAFIKPVGNPSSLEEGTRVHTSGFQFSVGAFGYAVNFKDVTYTSSGLHVKRQTPFSNGASLSLNWLMDSFQLGFTRQVFRHSPPAATFYSGAELSLVSFTSDEIWAYHGFRPWLELYLGYGLGYARREIILYHSNGGLTGLTESVPLGMLLADWSFSVPFSLRLKVHKEGDENRLKIMGTSLHLAYLIPF